MFLKRVVPQLALVVSFFFATTGVSVAAAGSETVAAAVKEGNLYIYGDLDSRLSALLVNEFEALYPGVKVDFITMPGSEVFSRHMRDVAARKISADILWNREITLQGALVQNGYALQYTPAENSSVMPAATLADSAYVTGFEPVVMAYNRKLVVAQELPVTRSALLQALKEERWQGKFATCDPDKSALAFLLLTQDLAYTQDFWGLAHSFGDAGLKLYPDYRAVLDRVESGEVLAGYNLPLSEVLKRVGNDKNIGWLYTTDYTLAIPETVLITKRATNPHAARLWIEYVRSSQAQQLISVNRNLFPVRSDVAGGEMKKQGSGLPSGRTLRIIGTGTEVTRFNENGLKRGFILKWKQQLKLVK